LAIKLEVCWALSNIAASDPEQVH